MHLQEDDGAFEKGKARICREEISFTEIISQAISRRLKLERDSREVLPKVDFQMLRDQLFVNSLRSSSASKEESSEFLSSEECTLLEFLELLKKEIEFIFGLLSPLTKVSAFEIRHFDLWIERLTKRALLWSALKKNLPEYDGQLDAKIFSSLQTSSIKPTRFNQILELLC